MSTRTVLSQDDIQKKMGTLLISLKDIVDAWFEHELCKFCFDHIRFGCCLSHL